MIHKTTVYGGDFTTPSRAYGYGDTGSLEVKLNGVSQFIAYLGENFVKTDKHQDQDMNGYDDVGFSNGTASFIEGNGILLLNKIYPFNGVTQSITSSEIIHSNGYQGWDASISITSKPRDGYNYLELIHNITSSITESLNCKFVMVESFCLLKYKILFSNWQVPPVIPLSFNINFS